MKALRSLAIGAATLLCFGTACTSDGLYGSTDPDDRLQRLLDEWSATRAQGTSCASGGWRYPYADCGRIQSEIERLALDYPIHRGVLMANAVIAFETDRPERAIDYLDALLDLRDPPAEAAVLRSRLAIQQGNLPHAQRLLENHVRLQPSHPELREALASVHYLQGNYEAARRALRIAERLGAPSARTAYNRGLIEEAEGNADKAIEEYRDALRQEPKWPAPRARILGLQSEQGL